MNMVGTTVRSGVSFQCVNMSLLQLALLKPIIPPLSAYAS